MIEYILGIITGLILAAINIGLWARFHITLQRNIEHFINKPLFKGSDQMAYISGMSEEESSYMDSLKEKEVKIL